MFGVNNATSSHTDNQKNNFLEFGEGSSQGIYDSTGSAEWKFSTNISKVKTKFCLSLHYNGDEINFL